MLKLILCTFYFLLINLAHAQNDADSFISKIKSFATYPEKIKGYLAFGKKIGAQNFDDAIRIKKMGLQLARIHGDSIAAGKLILQIGEASYFKGNYDVAARYFYESIILFEKIDEKSSLADSYNALAKLYRKTRDLKRSLENYDKAMAIFRSLNDSAGIAMIYNESGVVFEYAGQYDKAVERYSASLYIDERTNDAEGICYALSNLAGVYTLQNKFTEAEKFLMQALIIRKDLKNNFALALNYSDLGSVYSSAKNFVKAKLHIDTSNMIADKMGYPELKSGNYGMLAQIAEQEGDYKNGLFFYKKKSVIRDSIFSIEKANQIEELNTRYETEKKERKIAEQQNKIILQNILMASGLGLLILFYLLGYALYRKYKWRRETKVQADILKQQQLAAKAVIDAEEAERRRIATDLHDGVGQIMSAAKMNLSAYEHRVKFNSADEKLSFEKIIALVDAGCKEVRAVSHNMMPNALLKNNLASAIGEFINKLDQRALQVHFNSYGFEEGTNSNTETVLYRVIQECVNNVIKHSGADTVHISLIKDDKEISATIEDNGKGFDVNDMQKQEGIGLKNIRTRIEYLKGTVDIESSPGKGTLVALYVPVTSN